MSEVRVTNEETGGQKGSKIQRFSLLPWDVLSQDAELYGLGALKYEPRNWEKGYTWDLAADALGRHWSAWMVGEDLIPPDPDDVTAGMPHLTAVRFHAASLLRWSRTYPEGDFRG